MAVVATYGILIHGLALFKGMPSSITEDWLHLGASPWWWVSEAIMGAIFVLILWIQIRDVRQRYRSPKSTPEDSI
ncbi:hypothetical protein [Sphaerisporangium aureirubrum]|uniref:DUF3995 domain-containing protein n=1 Tax=Sphaerisporangium aureirubrum TaxID=1544736 RepID=A0ABW1NCM7_9ACTN